MSERTPRSGAFVASFVVSFVDYDADEVRDKVRDKVFRYPEKSYYRKIRLDFGQAAAFLIMAKIFSGKLGMAINCLSLTGISSGSC